MVICFYEVSNVSQGRFRVVFETSLAPPQRTTYNTFFVLSLQSHRLLSSLVYLLLHPVSPVPERPNCPLFLI